ncbi:unnamed protein product [Blumeria hordei]|uniref:Histone-lysine N-methyltransferase, H3 lysine-79 specific n=1 Tax=Blumeria hordei TaxID=2867405 RepID=A0A383UN10_BLUHO|nr:unnamed protein product [Blumeria hordei]
MSNLFNNKAFAIKATPARIRTERVRGKPKPVPILPKPKASTTLKEENLPPKCTARNLQTYSKAKLSSVKSSKYECTHDKSKRKLPLRRTPAPQHPLSSDSSDAEDVPDLKTPACTRQKMIKYANKKRKLNLGDAFSVNQSESLEIIHAADITSVDKRPKMDRNDFPAVVMVQVQYPSASQLERYVLMPGDNFNPVQEIINVITNVLELYFSEEQKIPLKGPDNGIIRKLTKAYNLHTKGSSDNNFLNDFKEAVEAYNTSLQRLLKDGSIGRRLDSTQILHLDMVECILQQVYARTVSPKVNILKQYENGTDNIYGELLPPFISRILAEASLTCEDVFVDLGSGVGNVVLQAALEFGCESWGCEMMLNACTLAEAQSKEFNARCRLWGIKSGRVNLECGDFLENPRILAAMKRADVILVNNQAFTPELNQKLKDLFLDFKNGCRIISLKPFVSTGHQISSRNLWDPANLLDVTKGEYHSGSVSWTDTSGTYYIARKDEKRLHNICEI